MGKLPALAQGVLTSPGDTFGPIGGRGRTARWSSQFGTRTVYEYFSVRSSPAVSGTVQSNSFRLLIENTPSSRRDDFGAPSAATSSPEKRRRISSCTFSLRWLLTDNSPATVLFRY